MKHLLEKFLKKEIYSEYVYNEFSLQHELGIYLREELNNEYKVFFEKNNKDIQVNSEIKREIDISIVQNNTLKCVIELKYINYKNQKGIKKRTESVEKDINFLKEVKKEQQHCECYFMMLTDKRLCKVKNHKSKTEGLDNEGNALLQKPKENVYDTVNTLLPKHLYNKCGDQIW